MLKIYSVRDAIGRAFIPPFFLPSDELAIREFAFCVNDASHQFHRFYQDYSLYFLGEFDDSAGLINALDIPVCILTGFNAFVPNQTQPSYEE